MQQYMKEVYIITNEEQTTSCLNVVRVILNYHVRCAEVEEAAYQIFGLEIRLQHSTELLFSFLGVDKILVV